MKKLLPVFAALFFLAGCIKDNFDAPPVGGKDPDMAANITLDSVKARYTGTPQQITQDWIIKVLVVGDDKEGNLYQMLAVEDSTAGIALKMDRSSLYADYPVGRRLFIKLKGLWIGDYAGVIQIGGYLNSDGEVDNIPSAVFDQHIFKGVYGLPVVPHAVSISQLNESYQNKLIELNGVEFQTSDAGKNYADGYNKVSVNRTLKDCNGGTVLVRTSGYASFANSPTATGNGKLLAIYSSYNGDAQLLIRSLDDVMLDTTRCGGGIIVGGDGILGLRASYGGSDVTIPSPKVIKGIVISNASVGNTDPKNMVLQDSTGGIVVRFTSNHSFVPGDEVEVNAGGLTLSDYNGLVQIINVPGSAATKTGTGTITPRIATTAQIQANASAWESTLVTIQNATISGSATWSGTTQINDGTGILNHFTRSAATFSATALPSGNKTFTGIVSNFNGVQLNIRDPASDVQ